MTRPSLADLSLLALVVVLALIAIAVTLLAPAFSEDVTAIYGAF